MTSRLRTPLCDLLGIDVPIVGAGMGGLAGAELAAAISSAGALGVIGAGGDSNETVIERLRDARALTSSPLGVNVVLEVVPAERVFAVLDEGVDVLFTGWGDPGAWIGACRERGTLLAHRVENTAEAVRAVEAGADVLIAQGSDAGGHTGSVPSLALIPCVVDVARGVPVLAAGGVGDGRGLVAALALGAAGVVIGTRFVAAAEANAHAAFVSRVIAADEAASVLTDAFEIGWPDRPHRVLRNSTIELWERQPEPRVRPSDRAPEIVAHRRNGGVIEDVPRYWVDSPTRDVVDGAEAMALYAGPSAGLVRSIEPAAAIVASIVADAERVLSRLPR